jgi:phage baseplate assembly protein gpV
MEASKFHFYSFGTVAANKPRRGPDGHICDLVEVFPKEKFTMSAGEITDNVDKIEVKGKDASGQDHQGEIKTKPSLTCKWIPIGEPNRITPPDVRRGEEVIIYRYADTQFYFWTTAFNNLLRKLETVAWWISGTDDETESERGPDNGYFIELSSHEKHLIFSTSKKNGEVVRYYLQFNMADGNFLLQDDLGQTILIDSVAGIIEVTSENEIIHNTKKYTINTDEYILNCKTSVVNASESATTNTKAFTVNADDSSTTTTKNFDVTASSGTSFTTPDAKFSAKVTIAGLLTWSGGMSGSGSSGGGGASATIAGKVAVTGGDVTVSGDVTAGGISLKGHVHTDPQGGKTGGPS